MNTADTIMQIHRLLLEAFGPQRWWPGETRFEVVVGAVLTQNTNWANVEKAIVSLKAAGALDIQKLNTMPQDQLAELIRPAGYYRLKAKRLKNLLAWLWENCNGDLSALEALSTASLRNSLLSVMGIGPETADSILLYALGREVFVVDTYTARVACRHRLIEQDAGYDDLQDLFQSALPADAGLFNEYHALLVRVGKQYCRPRARCAGCPLESLPHDVE